MEFSKRLIDLRKKKKLLQTDVAEKIGVARATYGAYEQGNRQPDFDTLEKIASFFGVSTDYLLGRSDIQNPEPVFVAGREINLSEEEIILFNELKKHPIMLHDLVSDPERKVKELIKLYKMKKLFLEDDEEEDLGDGFGTLKD
ncbi:transcriptional regulator, xre family [Bacillus sp. OxB-1]|uniref:helix-turn-helix domain-containing protein n=1 Tax=Bacillus sp. (strain OxB-1) TaxID=98228 RepID=UPI0005820895|nr:helix-turn-helix transcriptional regulator [Bacillus sp. OxB-1]BAQ11489.1 transcriptional regulator, xre family [Bacillus sp. OxB-1]